HGEYPKLNAIPATNFTCFTKLPGYYADPHPKAGCQVYHMCNMKGRKYSYLCPNHTLFNQVQLICDHWYNVDCTLAEANYKVNDNLFAEGKVKFETERPKPPSSFPVKLNANRTSVPYGRTPGLSIRKHKTPFHIPADGSRGRSQIVFQNGPYPKRVRVHDSHRKCAGCMTFFIRDGAQCTPCVWPR
ncbi:uncharacterized protein LOC111088749, partial [Limulus polyphemus]|uniref:Uncharacterized protein LOC111088749 n=1 Tax=Limulus polyphemus TaxID=6850 RepID=A0ABM1THJ1_LIMPO